MRLLVTLLTFFSSVSFALLPLPFLIEGADEEQALFETSPIDPSSIQGYSDLHLGGKLREMELPPFIDSEFFQVPPALKNRVAFWKQIYSEYTSDQALLHDAQFPELVYEVVDISSITKNPALSYRRQVTLLGRMMKLKKAEIARKLKSIEEFQLSPSDLPLDQFQLFKKFEGIQEEGKFKRASKRIRVQVGQRNHVVKGFFYGGRYFKKMMEIFEELGLPRELTRLPLVESAFNIHARSKVGASGVWQFMRSTGKLYLHIDKTVDERNDPLLATYAAAQLLRHNYETLQSWPLAITAYNHGREGMRRAVSTIGTNELSEIIKNYHSRTFGFASANFYSEFLAMLEVEREYRKHFGKLLVDSPLQFEEIQTKSDVGFSGWSDKCQLDKRVLAEFNPSLTELVVSGRAPVPSGFKLKIPLGLRSKCSDERVSITDGKYDRMRLRSVSKKGL